MILLKWYREWCEVRWNNQSIKAELDARLKKETICESCETLKHQLEIANFEKKQLLDRILVQPPPIPDRTTAPAPQAVQPRTVPWHVRRQMLEAEDRAKFHAQQQAAKEDKKPIVDVADMERELEIAAESREAAGNK